MDGIPSPSDDAHLYEEHNETLRAEIDAKKAEIVHGFPLPGLGGVAQGQPAS